MPPVGRYIRYWYTYRTAVAVVIAVALSGAIFWLYTQQVTCDTHVGTCVANISLHPEDRFVPGDNPDPNIVIVGIDDQSLKDIGRYPVPRDVYAKALQIGVYNKHTQAIRQALSRLAENEYPKENEARLSMRVGEPRIALERIEEVRRDK